jgi:hypothetical protein
MPPHKQSGRFPKCSEFRALGSGYTRFPLYSLELQEYPDEVVLTLPPMDWQAAWKRSMIFGAVYPAILGMLWLSQPRPLDLPAVLGTGAVLCLWPVYLPFLQRSFLGKSLPLIRFDRASRVVHLLANKRQTPVEDVIAICDVTVALEDGNASELQMVLHKKTGREFVLLTTRLDTPAERVFGPLATRIAGALGIPRLSVDAEKGTIVEHAPNGTRR